MGKNTLFFLLLVLSVLFISPLISADVEETIPYNVKFNLFRPCTNNGTQCSPASVCNISIIYPRGSVLFENATMTNAGGGRFNITIPQADVNQLGTYKAYSCCTDGSLSGCDTFEIEVTGDGFGSQSFPREFFFMILAFGLMIAGVFSDKLRILKHVGAMFLMVMGVVTLYPGFANINYTTLVGKAIGFGAIGMGAYFLMEGSLSRNEQEERFSQKDNRPDDGRFFHDNE